MATRKKTLYEILAIEPDASEVEIRAAYETRTAKLESLRGTLSGEDYEFKAKVLALAYKTLSVSDSRGAYDAKLAAEHPPEASKIPLSLLPLEASADAAATRSDVMGLRADMMAMRAGAYRPDALASDGPGADLSVLGGTLRRVLLLLGMVFALIIVMNMIVNMVAHRRTVLDTDAATKAGEKAALQEYYQVHGVRPASMAELRLLEAEDRRKESEAGAAQRTRAWQEEQARDFDREARERGERASEELRRNEQAAADRERRMEQERIYQEKQDQRMRDEAERQRIERLRREWNQELWRR